ncbi:MAG TPA: hypothetical protein VKS22_14645 [Candidatus Binataceae bacterium]|nr:hypothetical protein [Candidatus Binataceae bacterium]
MSLKPKESEKPFDKFQRLIRGLAAVPKKEIEAEEAKWRAARLLKKKPAKA